MIFKPRDYIVDNHDREGIVMERVKTPSRAWILEQRDQRVQNLKETTWWLVFCVSGGSVYVPEELAKFIRASTLDDARRVCANANAAGLRALASLFPELIESGLKQRGANKKTV